MENNIDYQSEERGIRLIRKVCFGLGGVFVLVGIVRQWPIFEKSYMEFIEGKGYLSLMLGLIMIVLGFSIRLLMGFDEEA